MANKFTNFLSEKAGKAITNIDVLNFIRDKASEGYKATVPKLAGTIDKPMLADVNHNDTVPFPVQAFQANENEFFEGLINRIGSVVVAHLAFENPLSVFKSETFEFGDTIEEIYVPLAEREDYNAKGNSHPFATVDTAIEVFFHKLNNENVYRNTINRAWLSKAFTSEASFDDLVDRLIDSLLLSDQLDEFDAVKSVLNGSLAEISYTPAKGGGTVTRHIKTVDIDLDEPDAIARLNREIRSASKQMTFLKRVGDLNPLLLPSVTPKDKQVLIISADYATELDTLYSNAYHIEKIAPEIKIIEVDEFEQFTGAGQNNGKTPIAFLVSENSIIFKDKLTSMEAVWDPAKLNYNNFYHHQYLTSLSLLHNIVAFTVSE